MPVVRFSVFNDVEVRMVYRTFAIYLAGRPGEILDVDVNVNIVNENTREIAIKRTRWLPIAMDQPIWDLFLNNECSLDTLTEDSFVLRSGIEEMYFTRVYPNDLLAAGRNYLRSRCRS